MYTIVNSLNVLGLTTITTSDTDDRIPADVLDTLADYNSTDVSDLVAFGFVAKVNGLDMVYIGTMTDFNNMITVQTNSDGFSAIRFCPTSKQKKELINKGLVKPLMTLAEFTAYQHMSYYVNKKGISVMCNKGETFERLLTETYTNETWTKDNICYKSAGDIEIDGININIKFEKGWLCKV